MMGSSNYSSWSLTRSEETLILITGGSIVCVGLAGNVLVIVLIALVAHMRIGLNFCLASLALADLIVLLFVGMLSLNMLLWPQHIVFGDYLCHLFSSIPRGSMVCSTLTFVLVAVERYTYVCRPVTSRGTWTLKKVALLLAVIWLVSLGAAVPYVYAGAYSEPEFNNLTMVYCSGVKGECGWFRYYDIALLLATTFLPTPLILVLYSKMVNRLRTSRQEGVAEVRGSGRPRRKSVVMLTLTAVINTLCRLPIDTSFLISQINNEVLQTFSLRSLTFYYFFLLTLMFINHSINPIIYMIMGSNFQEAFKILFCKCCKQFKYR